MTIISPSLLSCDFLNIESELNAFKDMTNIWFHLDVMDGHFVPNLTFGHPIIEKIVKASPHKCDAHFMVTNPQFYAETLKDVGLYNFTFHFEATLNPIGLIKDSKKNYPSVGISIKPTTPVHKLTDEILKNIDLILVMSVEPGFGGQAFMPEAFDKILELKKRRQNLNCTFQIQVDGGISDKNASELIKAGADNLVAGSYIFKKGISGYNEAVESLRK